MVIHGESKTRLYRIWKAMRTRCHNTNIPQYKDYGGRGISVCLEWDCDYLNFKNWAVNNGYDDSLSIDRINNNGNYEPNNCRWSTGKEQGNNKSSNVVLVYNEEALTLSQWGDKLNIANKTLSDRYCKGRSVEEILGVKPILFNFKPKIKILQLTLDGRVIREYNGVKYAKEITGIEHISSVLTGKRKSAGGYLWKYKE